MALIKWSGLISEFKGKLNGSIFSNPTYGAQVRNRRACKGHDSNDWGQIKSLLAVISSTWKDLTPTEQQSFIDRVALYPYVNKFGDSVNPSGYQLYCTLNLNRQVLGRPQLTTCVDPYAEVSFGTVAMQVGAAGTLEMTFTNPSSINQFAVLYVSPPQSTGVYYIPRKMKLTTQWLANTASPVNVDAAIAALYGAVADGQKYFWRLEVVDIRSGQRYGNYNGSLIVSGHA